MTRAAAPAPDADHAHIDEALREMFRDFSALPLPSRLLSVVDQLDESEPAVPSRRTA